METIFGGDFYFVHFNRQPGVADAIMNENASQFLRNIFCKNVPIAPPEPGMQIINLARAEKPLGDTLMEDNELSVFINCEISI
ncbi:hypothetical protein [Sphingobacterium sp. BIGb0165]|uniref:hypothetical protein n=1 Tax=Sphingobacterium sp. BIGb0165 TaxID=2940615 RepID=UPI0021687F8A|nr:hypothetical protein [Sphingobacterium sp. BIGb0165]MCS4224662.1 hypothetical protein [Sphingobacterium sp. BIGb0165]